VGLNPRRRASAGDSERRRRALMTRATCSSASGGNTARILGVARLVPPDARDRPQLLEEAGAVTGDGQGELARKRTRPAVHPVAVPLDLAVPAGDEWESLGVDLDPEPIRFPECPELLDRSLLQR